PGARERQGDSPQVLRGTRLAAGRDRSVGRPRSPAGPDDREVVLMRGHRLGIALATALLAVPALAGCGGGGDESPPGSFRYSWWGSGERNERTQAVIDLFEKAAPDSAIETEPTGDFNAYWEKLTVQSAAGGAPCAVQMQSRYMADYSERNHLRPLDEYVANGSIDISGIPESILETGKGSDGKLYSIPTGVFLYA